MTRMYVFFLCAIPCLLPAAEEVVFTFGFEGPDRIWGYPGETVRAAFDLTLTHSGPGRGAQGWSYGVAIDGLPTDRARIVSIDFWETEAAEFFNVGFERSEPTTGPGNEGATSAVVLAFQFGNLPSNSTTTVARIEVEVLLPDDEAEEDTFTLYYRDGLQGSGQPILISVSVCPDLHEPEVREKSVSLRLSAPFRRGDANLDGALDVSDPICILNRLFHGLCETDCLDASDTDDSGELDITDAIRLFSWQFVGGRSPPPPLDECGADPTADGLNCADCPACYRDTALR